MRKNSLRIVSSYNAWHLRNSAKQGNRFKARSH